MSAIEATLFTSILVTFLGLGVVIVTTWMDRDVPRVVGATLVGIGLLGVIGSMIWAVWSEVVW